jgi:hypothetical protein
MKLSLYNIYKSIILEATEVEQVQSAINKHNTVNIIYNDGTKNSSNMVRYCGVYAIGITDGGNQAIRVYQISGPNLRPNKNGVVERWKTLRLDRITSFNPTKFVFQAPADELYNINGDKTLNITGNGGGNVAVFNKK